MKHSAAKKRAHRSPVDEVLASDCQPLEHSLHQLTTPTSSHHQPSSIGKLDSRLLVDMDLMYSAGLDPQSGLHAAYRTPSLSEDQHLSRVGAFLNPSMADEGTLIPRTAFSQAGISNNDAAMSQQHETAMRYHSLQPTSSVVSSNSVAIANSSLISDGDCVEDPRQQAPPPSVAQQSSQQRVALHHQDDDLSRSSGEIYSQL